MTLPPLDEECPKCGGEGSVGGVKTATFMQTAAQCPRCHGLKRAPTEEGRALLAFLRLHGSVR